MFTGLVEGIARIVDVAPQGDGVTLTVDAGAVPGFAAAAGDSIALAGACMTATAVDGVRFTVDVSAESLSKTAGLDRPGDVNLERSLRLGDALGGHMVAGHVDGIGEVVRFAPVAESWELVVRTPATLAKYFATKGSVALDGVSLTVNKVVDTLSGCELSVNIIPHTYRATTLRALQPGAKVNLEADLIARYVERMLSMP
jgi:riboflavin synthase